MKVLKFLKEGMQLLGRRGEGSNKMCAKLGMKDEEGLSTATLLAVILHPGGRFISVILMSPE